MDLFNIIAGICSIVGLLVSLFTASEVIKISKAYNCGNKDEHSEVINKGSENTYSGSYAGRELYITMYQESEREFVVTHNADIKPVSYFTGRETEPQELRQRIEEGRKSVLVSGMEGTGICKRLYGESHVTTAVRYDKMALVYAKQGKHGKAGIDEKIVAICIYYFFPICSGILNLQSLPSCFDGAHFS